MHVYNVAYRAFHMKGTLTNKRYTRLGRLASILRTLYLQVAAAMWQWWQV